MKYLAVDIGQVICRLDFSSFNKKLSYYTSISENDSYNFLLRNQKLHDLGIYSMKESLEKEYPLLKQYEVADLLFAWNNTLKPNKIMINWLEKLALSDTKIVLVSNIGYEHANLIKDLLSSLYITGNVINFFSCECGSRKPNYVYYSILLNINTQFRGCVYLDDNLENLNIGKIFGFNSIWFDLSVINEDEIKDKLSYIEEKL